MKKIFLFGLIALVLAGFVLAEMPDLDSMSNKELIDSFCTALNNGEIAVPDDFIIPGYIPFKNERVIVKDRANTFNVGLIVSDGKIVNLSCSAIENPTYYLIFSNLNVVKGLATADDPIKELKKDIDNKDVIIEGIGFTKKVKAFFAKLGFKIFSWFA